MSLPIRRREFLKTGGQAALGSLVLPRVVLAQPSPMRILFIGNSLTYWNDGLWVHVERLAASGKPSIQVTTGVAVEGGAFLKSLWARTGPRRAIAAGPWDVVVLQEDLPETN